jgi:4-hydroxy-4-methyl-2-oxoglutarate aldolase
MTDIRPEWVETLRGVDTASIYNILKGLGRAEPASYSGPELRTLFPELGSVAGFAVTSSWTAGEAGGANADYLAFLEAIESSPRPTLAVLSDVGANPGRSGIAGDGMVKEFQVAGASAAIVGGSVMDIAGMEQVGLPVYVTGVVPAYDDLRMAAWGEPVMVGSLRVSTGDVLVGDRAGLVRIPPDAIEGVVRGVPGFKKLERSMQELLSRPGLTVAQMRAWYAENEPEFLGGESEGSAATTLKRAIADVD